VKKYDKFLVIMSMVMFIVTTAAILLGFYTLPPCKTNMLILCTFSLLGYGGSVCYYQEAKHNESDKDYAVLLFGLIGYIVGIAVIFNS